jgi:hypothetical protein
MKVRLTHHARERAAEMDVRTRFVKRALADPESVYPSSYGGGQQVAVRGNLAIPFEERPDVDGGDEPVRWAITVLWHGQTERKAC